MTFLARFNDFWPNIALFKKTHVRTNMNEITLSQADVYRIAYEALLAKLPESVRLKVLQAKTDLKMQGDSEVVKFIKRVIAMAEQDDK